MGGPSVGATWGGDSGAPDLEAVSNGPVYSLPPTPLPRPAVTSGNPALQRPRFLWPAHNGHTYRP